MTLVSHQLLKCSGCKRRGGCRAYLDCAAATAKKKAGVSPQVLQCRHERCFNALPWPHAITAAALCMQPSKCSLLLHRNRAQRHWASYLFVETEVNCRLDMKSFERNSKKSIMQNSVLSLLHIAAAAAAAASTATTTAAAADYESPPGGGGGVLGTDRCKRAVKRAGRSSIAAHERSHVR